MQLAPVAGTRYCRRFGWFSGRHLTCGMENFAAQCHGPSTFGLAGQDAPRGCPVGDDKHLAKQQIQRRTIFRRIFDQIRSHAQAINITFH